VYPHATPEYFSEFAAQARSLGARLIGGCCGTTPTEIGAISGAIAEDRAPCEWTGRIDCNHPDVAVFFACLGRQTIDQCALAGARRPRDADDIRASRPGVNSLKQLDGGRRFVFHEGNRTRERAAVAREHTGDELLIRRQGADGR